MYRAVLVDNDPWALDRLRLLTPWAKHSFVVAGTYTDSAAALEAIIYDPPELIVAEARMPGLDGLELLRRVRAAGIKCECALVSGYAEFDYVRSAIADHAAAYLLKPVEPEDMGSLLHELAARIDRNNHIYIYNDDETSLQRIQKQSISQANDDNRPRPEIIHRAIDIAARQILLFFVLRQPARLEEAVRALPGQFSSVGARLEDFADLWNELAALLNLQASDGSMGEIMRSVKPDILLRRYASMQTACEDIKNRLLPLVKPVLPPVSERDAALKPLLIEVHSRYEQRLSLLELANKHHISVSQCGRLFQRVTGGTFSDYLIRLRLASAHRVIQAIEDPPANLYELVGYNDIYYFKRSYEKFLLTRRQPRAPSLD